MNREYNIKNKYLLGFTLIEIVVVIAVIAILAAVLIPTFSKIITSAQITKHHSIAKNIYNEYLQNVNDNLIDDLAIKTEEDVYVIYIDGEAIDGIYSYDEVKEKFKYSLVKKYNNDDSVLVVYDYDVNNPNSYFKISIEINDIINITDSGILLSYVKLSNDYSEEQYKLMTDELYNNFINVYKEYYSLNITHYIDMEIFEEYVILSFIRNDYLSFDLNYSDFIVINSHEMELVASESRDRESDRNIIDFIFIPKCYVIDKLNKADGPKGDAETRLKIKYKLKEVEDEKRIAVYLNRV